MITEGGRGYATRVALEAQRDSHSLWDNIKQVEYRYKK